MSEKSTIHFRDYYAGPEELHRLGVKHETPVHAAFQRLLEAGSQRTEQTILEVEMMCSAPHSFSKPDSKEVIA